jgi:hypothetical protein
MDTGVKDKAFACTWRTPLARVEGSPLPLYTWPKANARGFSHCTDLKMISAQFPSGRFGGLAGD